MRVLLGAAAAVLLAAAPAQAANRLTIDPHPARPGHVLLNPPGSPPGSVLVAWISAAPTDDLAPIPRVCVIPPGGGCAPQTLEAPDGTGADQAIVGLFPVLANGVLTLVGPRDTDGAAITWTAAANGAFAPGKLVRGAYPAMTGPQDVVAAGATTLIGTVNPGLGIGSFGAARGAFGFAHPGEDVKSASLALDRNGRPVQAYFDLGDDPFAAGSSVLAYRYTGAGSLDDEESWSGPAQIAHGVEPVLTGGASGLFMVDVDTPADSDSPTLLDLRKDDGTAFGPPVTLSDDPGAELFDAGAAAQSPAGRLAILWPQTRSGDGLKVMRLFTSTDGGASFAQTDVATLGDSYIPDRNASAAVGDDGTGAVAYVDDGGLELADFTPVAPFVAPPPPPVIAPPGIAPPPVIPAPVVFTSRTVGGLRYSFPRGCVRPGAVALRVAQHGVRAVTFRLDGGVRLRRRRAPFALRVHARPGSRHVVSARVVARLHGRTVVRRLRHRFTVC